MHTATALATLTLLTSTALAQTPSLTIIEPPADLPATRSVALSRDGSTLIGFATPPGRGFTWTRSDGYFDYTPANGYVGQYGSFGVSANGATVVGAGFTGGIRAYRSFGTGAPQDLGAPWDASFSGGIKSVLGMWTNHTGTRVIASMQRIIGSAAPERNPFVWTQATNSWQPLIPSQQSLSDYVDANDASDDGSVVVGQVNEGGFFGAPRAFVSTPSGFSILPRPSQVTIDEWYATAVNGPGNIVVGTAGGVGAIWRDGVPSVLAPNLPNILVTIPTDVSNDGNIVVGTMEPAGGLQGFVWTPSTGTQTLDSYLAGFGLSIPSPYAIQGIHLSGDGTTIGGWYQPTLNGNPVGDSRAFVFTVPAPSGLALLGAGAFALTRRRR